MKDAYPRRGSQYAANRRAGITTAPQKQRFALKRSLLPTPLKYYSDTARLTLSAGSVWRSAICPFHDDTRPSLRINLDRGNYCCMVCGAKGKDIIAFHMARTGLRFIEACKDLGAWQEDQA